MKITKEQQEFIKYIHLSSGVWGKNIEKKFPKLFKKDELDANCWYKLETSKGGDCIISHFNGDLSSSQYGFNTKGEWNNRLGAAWFIGGTTFINKMNDEEVKEALMKEAKRLGFEDGVKFQCLYNHTVGGDFIPMLGTDGLLWLEKGCVFRDGVWAIPLETITKEEAEKQLGKTIVN
jgi:hypothetical protein